MILVKYCLASYAVKCIIYEISLRVRNSDLSFWLHYLGIRTILFFFVFIRTSR